MTKRAREILDFYRSENAGVLSNLARMINHGRLAGTGTFVILPVDQGFEHGPARSFAPNPPGYDPRYHFSLACDAGCNAYAAPLGFLEAGAAEFAGEIPLILKLNNHDLLHDSPDPEPAVTGSVTDALRLGCAAVGYTIYPGSSACVQMYEQLREIAEEAKAHGLAVVVWSYPRGSGISKEGETGASMWSPTRRRSRRSSAPTSSRSSCRAHISSSPKRRRPTRPTASRSSTQSARVAPRRAELLRRAANRDFLGRSQSER